MEMFNCIIAIIFATLLATEEINCNPNELRTKSNENFTNDVISHTTLATVTKLSRQKRQFGIGYYGPYYNNYYYRRRPYDIYPVPILVGGGGGFRGFGGRGFGGRGFGGRGFGGGRGIGGRGIGGRGIGGRGGIGGGRGGGRG